MTRTLLAIAMLAVTGAANAAPSLSWAELAGPAGNGVIPVSHPFNKIDGVSYTGTTFATAPNVSLGGLYLDNAAKVTFTYLGSEAGYDNNLWVGLVNGTLVFSTQTAENPPAASTVGDEITVINAAGALNFTFEGKDGNYAVNGGTWSANTSIGLIKDTVGGYTVGGSMVTNPGTFGKTFQYVIGYNDSAADLTDWDDMVIGVNIAPIPEPETYAMLLAGLGLMGFVARRRKQATQV
jgi:hypothetical protein